MPTPPVPRLSEYEYNDLADLANRLYGQINDPREAGGGNTRRLTAPEIGVLSMKLQAVQMQMLILTVDAVIAEMPSL